MTSVVQPQRRDSHRREALDEERRRVSNGEQYLMATSAALAHPVSRTWKGYWQRAAG